MKKRKGKKKTDDIRVFESTYLAAINRNQELIKENKSLTDELEGLKSANTIIKSESGKRKYLINLKMYRNNYEGLYDFTGIIQFIQFEGPELLIKLLRQIHHNYSVMNINEMTTALNKHEFTLGSYSESIPNELYILKTLADKIEAIQEIQQ